MSLPKDEPSDIKQFINDSIGKEDLNNDGVMCVPLTDFIGPGCFQLLFTYNRYNERPITRDTSTQIKIRRTKGLTN